MKRSLIRNHAWSVVLLLAVWLSLPLAIGAQDPVLPEEDGVDQAYSSVELFTRVLQQVRELYVDEDLTTYRDLIYSALNGMLSSLDPYSQFMDPDMYSEMQDETAGRFGGLGIVVSMRDSTLTVVAPMEDTPGFRAGLLASDRIIEIDGNSTEGVSLGEAIKQLRGAPGSLVSLKIYRPATRDVLDVEIERALIEVKSVKGEAMLDDSVGYVRITQFAEPTGNLLLAALETLSDQGMKALVLDLRNNPGGLLSSAVEVSQLFLPRDKLVVTTRGRDRKVQSQYMTRGRKMYKDLPMVILVDGGSASAAEIVSGALQDHRRAVLVGEKTFGKGSVQSVLPHQDGSAVRLTTAKYYTPSERVIHERGIEPDIVVPLSPEEWLRLAEQRSRPDNLVTDGNGEAPEDSVDLGDRQLNRAVDILHGILIFQAKGETVSTAEAE